MKSAHLGAKLGILGGGQLARMLAQAAQAMGLEPVILARSLQEPAAQVCRNVVIGTWEDPEVLKAFLESVPVVIFENEFIQVEALRIAASRCAQAPRFVPALESIHEVQNKLRQKRLLEKLGISTSPWAACPLAVGASAESIDSWITGLRAEWNDEVVLKWAELGYDGKGTWIAPRVWNDSTFESARRFTAAALEREIEVYGERKVDFRRELAIVACRSDAGGFMAYPLVISEQRDGICRKVLAPATAFGVAASLERLAGEAARQVGNALPLEGVFALEFFETSEGALWVNEMAPRVHNTGHFTQNATATSQFENHVRAAVGHSLGSGAFAAGTAGMLNLLGPEGVALDSAEAPAPVIPEFAHLHWYGKAEFRAGRKLGHVNVAAADSKALLAAMEELQKIETSWGRRLQALPKRKD